MKPYVVFILLYSCIVFHVLFFFKKPHHFKQVHNIINPLYSRSEKSNSVTLWQTNWQLMRKERWTSELCSCEFSLTLWPLKQAHLMAVGEACHYHHWNNDKIGFHAFLPNWLFWCWVLRWVQTISSPWVWWGHL